MRRSTHLTWLYSCALLVSTVDFVTKNWAVNNLTTPRKLIGSLLQLTLVRNPGAAFSMATGFTIIFTALSLAVLAFILYYSPRITSRGWALVAGLVLGGVIGNLGDRIFRSPGFLYGHVVDWIELPNFPVFNFADIAISSAAAIAAILTIRNVRPIELKESTGNE